MCKWEVYAYYRADKPELDFPWHVRADGKELDAVLTPRKFSVKHAKQDIVRWCELNPRRLPKNGGTVVLDLDHIWKPV
jgi:hypothetical protein